MSEASQPQPDRQEQEISLDELTAAFAEAMGAESPPPPQTQAIAEPDGEAPSPEQEPAADPADPCPVCPRSILEAMLFVGNRESEPLSSRRAAELMRDVEPEEIPELIDQLNRRYSANGCPYHIVSQGAGYRLTLRKAFDPVRNRFYGRIREARLSQAAIDTLAIVAYQQPLTAEQIGRLRGRPSGHVLAQLVRRGLLRIERRQTKRRTAEYLTTDRFLKVFGIESLKELPRSEQLDQ